MSAAWESFEAVQRSTLGVLDAVCGALEPGMSEADIRADAADRLHQAGFRRQFHAPAVRIGAASRWRSWLGRRTLSIGDIVAIDLAPATDDAFGDAGVTLCFRGAEPRTLQRAREAVRATAGFAAPTKTVGELYVFARAWLNTRQLTLGAPSVGHRCMSPEQAVGWPTGARAATVMRRHQIGLLNPRRLRGVWAVRVPVDDGAVQAAFEELIYVGDDGRRVLGRDGLEWIGSFPSAGMHPRTPPGMKGEPGTPLKG
jgi:hypothetical protein